MKTIIAIAFLAVSALALPVEQGVSLTQDTLGNYKLLVKTEDSSRSEQGSETGNIVGSYTFTDKDGGKHTVKYVASESGFKAEGDLPVPVQETAEVAAVRAAHLAEVKRAKALLPTLPKDDVEEIQVFVPVRLATPIAGRQILFAENPQATPVLQAEPPHARQLIFAEPHQARQIDLAVPHQGANFASRELAVDNTAEIEAAKAIHFAAHKQALADLADVYRKIQSS